MKERKNKLKQYVLTHKIISIIVLVVLVFVGNTVYKKMTSTAGDTRYVFTKAQKSTIISSISGSGQVSATNQIDIKAKVSGDVIYVKDQTSDMLNNGTLIAEIDPKDAQKTVRDRELDLASAKIALQKLQTQKSSENMNADLAKAYEDGFSAVSDTFIDLPDIVNGLNDILSEDILSDNAARISGNQAKNYREKAVTDYNNAQISFEKTRIDYRKLTQSSPSAEIDNIINETYDTTKLISDATKSTRNFVDFMAEDTGRSSSYTSFQSTLSGYVSTTSADLSKIYTNKTSIKDTKDTFVDSDLDIQSSLLSVQQKQNALADAKDKLADYFIRAPFNGTLAGITIKKGDSVSSGTVVATFVTKQQNAVISMNEVDVAKIKIGQKATLTFDAIPDLTITGIVSEMDGVGTVSQGVVTYNVKITFDTGDDRVLPGMSVSSAIITDMKQDVLSVPNGAVKSQNGASYVEEFNPPLPAPTDGLVGSISQTPPTRIPVEIGISNDSMTEIISGLNEGDEIVSRTILPSSGTTAAAPSLFGGNNRAAGSTVRVQAR